MEILYSKTGSEGNASVITDGKTIIQIDAGIKPAKVNTEIGYGMNEVSAVLVGHAHADHSAYISDYIKMGIKVYAQVDDGLTCQINVVRRWVNEISARSQFRIGTFIIMTFNVPHTNTDGTDCPNLGFLIYSTVAKERMLWVTDCAYIENRFPPLDYICMECSYLDVDDYSDKLEHVNKFVEKRRINSHMSLNRCIDFLSKQDLSKCKEVRLLHLTKSQGNIKEVMLNTLHDKFPDIKFVI